MPDRAGWPTWAVERVECANCGVQGYADRPAPPKMTAEYESWVCKVWPDAVVQKTRIGVYVWHSLQCASVWKKMHAVDFGYVSGWRHQHQIRMDERRLKSGIA